MSANKSIQINPQKHVAPLTCWSCKRMRVVGNGTRQRLTCLQDGHRIGDAIEARNCANFASCATNRALPEIRKVEA